EQGTPSLTTRLSDDLAQTIRVGAEFGPTLLHVRAAHVQLVAVDRGGKRCRGFLEATDDRRELLDSEPDDIEELSSPRMVSSKPGHLKARDLGESRIGEADGVDHAPIEFGNTRLGGSGARLDADRLRHEAADRVQIEDVFELGTIARSAGGENDWITKSKGAVSDGEPAVSHVRSTRHHRRSRAADSARDSPSSHRGSGLRWCAASTVTSGTRPRRD